MGVNYDQPDQDADECHRRGEVFEGALRRPVVDSDAQSSDQHGEQDGSARDALRRDLAERPGRLPVRGQREQHAAAGVDAAVARRQRRGDHHEVHDAGRAGEALENVPTTYFCDKVAGSHISLLMRWRRTWHV